MAEDHFVNLDLNLKIKTSRLDAINRYPPCPATRPYRTRDPGRGLPFGVARFESEESCSLSESSKCFSGNQFQFKNHGSNRPGYFDVDMHAAFLKRPPNFFAATLQKKIQQSRKALIRYSYFLTIKITPFCTIEVLKTDTKGHWYHLLLCFYLKKYRWYWPCDG